MTQKKSSNEEVKAETKPEDDIEIVVEGETPLKQEEPAKEVDIDVEALRKQVEELQSARELADTRALQAEREAQQWANQANTFKQAAGQSQYDTIVTALGAAQIEVDTAKRDIMIAGASQDYGAMADAQERLAAAKAHMIGLEQGKSSYETNKVNPRDTVLSTIESNPNLMHEEKRWLSQHPDALSDFRLNTKLNAAYFDAMDKGLQRGTPDYFEFIEEKLGYRTPKMEQKTEAKKEEDESSVMVAAPPSRGTVTGTGTGGKKTSYHLTKEEADVARLAGITPAEYVKQREILRERQRRHPGDYPED